MRSYKLSSERVARLVRKNAPFAPAAEPLPITNKKCVRFSGAAAVFSGAPVVPVDYESSTLFGQMELNAPAKGIDVAAQAKIVVKQDETRSSKRANLLINAEVRREGRTSPAPIHNVSVTGLLIETSEDLRVGDPVELEFPSIGSFVARVVWRSGHFVGCEFETPLPQSVIRAILRESDVVWPDFTGEEAREGPQHRHAETGPAPGEEPRQFRDFAESGPEQRIAGYYFHVESGGRRETEPVHIHVSDPSAVRNRALKEARALAAAEARDGFIDFTQAIVVEDAWGNPIVSVSLSEAVKIRS